MSYDWAGGGLVTTADDLARFLHGLFDGSLLGERGRDEMTMWNESVRWHGGRCTWSPPIERRSSTPPSPPSNRTSSCPAEEICALPDRLDRMSAENGAIPAATVVLGREGDDGLEVLMLRRNSKLAFGGMWVFPGGRVDDADRTTGDDEVTWARTAAVREAAEETGLAVHPDSLVAFSKWVPPPIAPKRFATWFFLAPAPSGEVVVDMGEIHDHLWAHPSEVLARRDAGAVELAPPTWVTLHWLSGFESVASAQASVAEPSVFATRVGRSESPRVVMWAGDAGYETGDVNAVGPRHRLVMQDRWEYLRTV